MTHNITVTIVRDDTTDDCEWTVGGEHDQRCEVWYECTKAWHRHPKNEFGEMDEWSTKRVPQEHQWIDGSWCVHPEGACGYDEADHGEIYWALVNEDAPLGSTWGLHIEWDEWWNVTLGDLIPASTTGSTE